MISERVEAIIDTSRAAEFVGDDTNQFSSLIDLGLPFAVIAVDVPTIDSAAISIYVQNNDSTATVPIPVHFTKSDDTTAIWASSAGTGGYSITVIIGGYQFLRVFTSQNQSTNRTFVVRGVKA